MTKVIVGLMGSSVASGSHQMTGSAKLLPFLQMLDKHHVRELDTARVYNQGQSEEDYGDVSPDAKTNFELATKAPGFFPGALSHKNIIDNCNASLKALKQETIQLYYFHGPDRQTPLEESCRAIDELHREGKIQRFGVSNLNRDEVVEIHSICKKNSWVLPTVYQGGYNGLQRLAETELFPTLRKLNMAFYAYSPLGGGYFSRPVEQLRSPPAGGRMDQMKVFSNMYVNDLSLKLHDSLTATCKKEGLSLKEAALRWLIHHSALKEQDGVILGGSSTEQMDENLTACEGGPLPKSVVEGFEDLWKQFSDAGHAPAYCV